MDYVPELIPLLSDTYASVTSRAGNRASVDGHIHMKNAETRKKFQSMLVGVFRSITYWKMTTLVSFLLCNVYKVPTNISNNNNNN